MGSSEIWDKYHSCCIGNGKFPIQHLWYLSQISLLPMLLLVHIQHAIVVCDDIQVSNWNIEYSYMNIAMFSVQGKICV